MSASTGETGKLQSALTFRAACILLTDSRDEGVCAMFLVIFIPCNIMNSTSETQ